MDLGKEKFQRCLATIENGGTLLIHEASEYRWFMDKISEQQGEYRWRIEIGDGVAKISKAT